MFSNAGQMGQRGAQARQAQTLKNRFQAAFEYWNDMQDIINLFIDVSTGDPTDMMIKLLSQAQAGLQAQLDASAAAEFAEHHVFSKEFRDEFDSKKLRIDVDDFTRKIDKRLHKAVHGGQGWQKGNRGGVWNLVYRTYFGNRNRSQYSRRDVDNIANGLMALFGVEPEPMSRYSRAGRRR